MTTTEQLVDTLAAAGRLPAGWRRAFLAVRREWFIPPRVWVDDEHGEPVPLDRHTDPRAWCAAVYANQPILTQFDDGHTLWPDTGGQHCTSSASQPDLVLRMLDTLDVGAGQRVLEIGTGTGYNAALLAEQVGPTGTVTSIEIDPALAGTARTVLAEHGFTVTVLSGDGAAGHPPVAPYDRIIATASIPIGHLPYAWVRQTRPGGVILAPIRTDYAAGSELVRFVVNPDGTATGHPVGPVGFMPLRQHRSNPVDPADLTGTDSPVRVSHTRLKPWRVANTWAARWAIGTQVPACRWHHDPPTAERGEHTLWFTDQTSRSWARVRYTDSPAPRPVHQAGPRNLWGEVETAFRHWKALGKPDPEHTTLTLTPHGQRITLTTTDEKSSLNPTS